MPNFVVSLEQWLSVSIEGLTNITTAIPPHHSLDEISLLCQDWAWCHDVLVSPRADGFQIDKVGQLDGASVEERGVLWLTPSDPNKSRQFPLRSLATNWQWSSLLWCLLGRAGRPSSSHHRTPQKTTRQSQPLFHLIPGQTSAPCQPVGLDLQKTEDRRPDCLDLIENVIHSDPTLSSIQNCEIFHPNFLQLRSLAWSA